MKTHISETQLKNIIKESVKKVLGEGFGVLGRDPEMAGFDDMVAKGDYGSRAAQGYHNAYQNQQVNPQQGANGQINEEVNNEREILESLGNIFGVYPVDVEGGKMWYSEKNKRYSWSLSELLGQMDLSDLDAMFTYQIR